MLDIAQSALDAMTPAKEVDSCLALDWAVSIDDRTPRRRWVGIFNDANRFVEMKHVR
jgi:hypothetical protein